MFGTLDVCLVPTQKLFSFRVWLLIGTWIRADLNLWYPPQESFTLSTVLWMGCVGGGLWGFGSASENKILKQKHLFFKKKQKNISFQLEVISRKLTKSRFEPMTCTTKERYFNHCAMEERRWRWNVGLLSFLNQKTRTKTFRKIMRTSWSLTLSWFFNFSPFPVVSAQFQ